MYSWDSKYSRIRNFFDNFNVDILWSLSEQIDALKIQNKQKDENVALSIFCPKCRKKHALRECPLDLKSVETCVISVENHGTKECPSIPGLKFVYQKEVVPNQVDPLCFIAKRPWHNPQPNIAQAFNTQPFTQSSQSN